MLYFLCLQDERTRSGWGWKPFRQILHRTHGLLEAELGYRRAERWLDQFLQLVRLTHWILPYPSDRALIESTKTSQGRGLSRKLMWFSAVFDHPELTERRTEESNPRTLQTLIYRAHRSAGRDGSAGAPWGAFQLIEACREQGIKIPVMEEDTDYWCRGRKSAGSQGWLPVWERGRPPLLEMQERIRGMSMDELEALMVDFTQERGATTVGGAGATAARGATSSAAASATSSRRLRTPAEIFQQVQRESQQAREQRSESGSVFVPSTD